MKRLISLISALLIVLLAFSSCGKNTEEKTEKKENEEHVKVLFTMENGDTFTLELYPEYAPLTVQNFVDHVNNHDYDGTVFHRIIPGFMAQGGAFLPNGTQRRAESIKGEMYNNGFVQNTLKHTRGVISMARINGNYDSASNQFFICYDTAINLDGEYAAFGEVIEGMETIDSFLEIERTFGSDGAMSSPVKPVMVEKAEVIS